MAKPLKVMIVERAIEIISDPSKWTRCTLARGVLDDPCDPTKPWAVRWCAQGAMLKAGHELAGINGPLVDGICRELYHMFPRSRSWLTSDNHEPCTSGISYINDELGREAAIAALAKYIEIGGHHGRKVP